MEKVPKIVLQRLRAATPVANHPDADVLTAFAEHSLPQRERETILQHLSHCGDCREVVALALPETSVAPAQIAPSRSAWLTWPVLRWGFALAGIAVVASLGVVRYSRQTAPTMAKKTAVAFPAAAKNEVVASPPVTARSQEQETVAAGKQQPKAQASDLLTADAKKAVTSLKSSDRDEGPVVGLRASGSGAAVGRPLAQFPHGPKVAFQNQANQGLANSSNAFATTAPSAMPSVPPAPQPARSQLAANLRVPAPTQTVKVEAAAPAIEADKLDLQNQPISTPSVNDGYGESRIEKTKPVGTVIGPSKALASSSPSETHAYDFLSPSPRWAITSHGTLQRSFDQGASWQDVPVKGGPVGVAGGMMMTAEAISPAKTAALAKRKDAAKQGATPEPPMVFRAVAALGNEVWAGGTAGQLYHSIDEGSHWVQVLPTSGKAMLTGDIVSLEFSDSQHGRVTTSTPEVWLTTDGGQNWQKQ